MPKEKHTFYFSKKTYIISFATVLCLFILLPVFKWNTQINIISINLWRRQLVLEEVENRLKLMIGFTLTGYLPTAPPELGASARLSRDGEEYTACTTICRLDYYGGNFTFYLPAEISPGPYDLALSIINLSTGDTVTEKIVTLDSLETATDRDSVSTVGRLSSPDIPGENSRGDARAAAPTAAERERGYLLGQRPPFTPVRADSAPSRRECVASLAGRLAANEYEPLTFYVHALENLAAVRVTVSPLRDDAGTPLPSVQVHTMLRVPDAGEARFQAKGTDSFFLMARTAEAKVDRGRSQRFWLTIHAPAHTPPGLYNGTVTIEAPRATTHVPLRVEVLPFTLQERPDREYGLRTNPTFRELTARDLTPQDRHRLAAYGLQEYRSLKEHGLTTVISQSALTFCRLPGGQPDLRDLESALAAFSRTGFSGPFIYSCGHLVQNAKPGQAGSTLGYDGKYHPDQLGEIVRYARENFPKMAELDFYWMPGEEVEDSGHGPDRIGITGELLQPLWANDEKTAISAQAPIPWPVDIKLGEPLPLHGRPWYFPASLATVSGSENKASLMRRDFGLALLSSPYAGIVPRDLSAGTITHPDPAGPLSTPAYEAVREGIDDGRYAYVLENLITAAKAASDRRLSDLGGQAQKALDHILRQAAEADLAVMDASRSTMIEWIETLLAAGAFPLPAGAGRTSSADS